MPHDRRLAGLAAALLGAGGIVLLGFADGGYFESSWPPPALAFAAAAGLAALAPVEIRLSRGDAVLVGGLAAFAAWEALSAAWSLEPADSLREAERGLVYVAAALAYVAVARRGLAVTLVAGLLAGATVIAGYSVADRLIEGPREEPLQGTLLIQPLGYANALGLLAALGLVSVLGFAAAKPSARALAVAAPILALFVVTLLLTHSRGAWLAAAAGAGTLAVFSLGRAAVRAAWLACLGLAVAAVLIAPLVVNPTTLERVLSDRPYYWWTAWHALPDHLPLGSGAGTFDLLWAAGAPIELFVRDAHSLYVETLVELGPLGLALVMAALLAPLATTLRAPPAGPTATAAAAYVVFLVHAGFDWDWEMPAVSLFGIGCGAALLARGGRPWPKAPPGEAVVALACVLVVAAAAAYALGK